MSYADEALLDCGENARPTTPAAPEYPVELVEIARHVAGSDTNSPSVRDKARKAIAELEPVDPLVEEARQVVKAFYPEMKPTYNGRRLAIAIECLKRGRNLTITESNHG